MRLKLRGQGLFGDVFASGLLVGLTALVNFATLFVFARRLEPEDFGLFSTCRRVVAFVAPFASLGLHLGASRYIGYYAREPRRRSAVLALAVVLSAAVVPTTAGLFVLLEHFGGRIEWVAALDAQLWLATAALAAATGAGLIVFSVLRGFGHAHAANLHQLATLGSLLGIGFGLGQAPVDTLLLGAAIASAIVNVVFLVRVLRAHRSEWQRPTSSELRATTREIGGYSVTRLADGPLQASLSLVGVLLAPAVGGLALAGYVHMSQTFVRITEVLVMPLSVIFLPLVAQHVREGKLDEVRRHAQLVYDTILLAGLLIVAHGLVWGGALLVATVGDQYSPAVPYLVLTLPAVLPFLLFTAFRSFIDGYSVRPMNSLHLAVATAVTIAASALLRGPAGGMGISIGFAAGVFLLGGLTVGFVHRQLGVRAFGRDATLALAVSAVPAVCGLPLARAVAGWPGVIVIAVFIAFEILALGLAGWAALRYRHAAAVYLASRLRAVRRSGRTSGESGASSAHSTRSISATPANERTRTPLTEEAVR